MRFTLEYWVDDGWYVGRLVEIPGVFSQGETLGELEKNVADAYRMMQEENGPSHPGASRKELELAE